MGIIWCGSPSYLLDEYDKATKDLDRAQADLQKALYEYGRAAARQVQNLQLMGAPDHETARQWVRDWKRAGILPHRQGPVTREEFIVGGMKPTGDKEYRIAKRFFQTQEAFSSPAYTGTQLYQLGIAKGKQLERARRRKKK